MGTGRDLGLVADRHFISDVASWKLGRHGGCFGLLVEYLRKRRHLGLICNNMELHGATL